MGKCKGLPSISLSYTLGTNLFLQHSDMHVKGQSPKSTKLNEKNHQLQWTLHQAQCMQEISFTLCFSAVETWHSHTQLL